MYIVYLTRLGCMVSKRQGVIWKHGSSRNRVHGRFVDRHRVAAGRTGALSKGTTACAEVDKTNLHVTCLRAGIRGSAVSLPMLTS